MKVLSCSHSRTALVDSENVAPPVDSAGDIRFKVYESVHEIPRMEWEELVPESQSCLRYDFLAGIEAGGKADMRFRYVLFYQDQQAVAFAAFQLIRFDVGKIGPYAKKTGASRNLWQRMGHGISAIAKEISRRFSVKILVMGNAFLTGEHGFYLRPGLSQQTAFEALQQAIDTLKASIGKVRVVLLKDFFPTESHPKAYLQKQQYHTFHADPNMILHLQPEWESFDHYLDSMSSKYRQRARSAFKKSNSLVSREMNLEEMLVENDRIQHLFSLIADKDRFVLQGVSENYFCELKRAMGDQLRVTGYYQEDHLVAFMTHIPAGKLLEAHYLGYDPSVNRELKIYQRMMYDSIRYAIDHGFSCISMGRTAMEIKSAVGAEANQMNMYLHITRPFINRLARPIMQNLTMEAWTPRNPFR